MTRPHAKMGCDVAKPELAFFEPAAAVNHIANIPPEITAHLRRNVHRPGAALGLWGAALGPGSCPGRVSSVWTCCADPAPDHFRGGLVGSSPLG
jgi:hypothetical protein